MATLLSFSARWVRLLGKRYNEHGPDSLGDRRQGNGSAPAILTPEALSSLKERLKTPPDDGGLWTGPKVARGSRASIALKPCMISAAGTHWSPSGIPSRNQGRAIPTRQAKRSARRSKKIQDAAQEETQKHPDAAIEIWAMDEHRIGLKPILRGVWASKGQRPTELGHHRYEWLYVWGFVEPAARATVWNVSNAV